MVDFPLRRDEVYTDYYEKLTNVRDFQNTWCLVFDCFDVLVCF